MAIYSVTARPGQELAITFLLTRLNAERAKRVVVIDATTDPPTTQIGLPPLTRQQFVDAVFDQFLNDRITDAQDARQKERTTALAAATPATLNQVDTALGI